jgi:hypothetical protein
MTTDLRIVPEESGGVSFEVFSSSEDSKAMLLQRLYSIMLCGASEDGYRNQPFSLVDMLDGANMPSVGHLDSLIALACATAIAQLDNEDKDMIDSFVGKYNIATGGIECTLRLKDGAVIKGTIGNG